MAHDHAPSPERSAGASAAAHATAEDEYLVTPPGSGHEHTDASVGVIVRFGLWLAVSAVVVHIGVWLMFLLFVEQRAEVPAEQPFPIAVGQEPRLPSAPRLQQSPVNEYYQFRLQEDDVMQRYGWVDRGAGRVQIPIEEAMRLTVERGLPSRAAAPEPQATAAAPGLIPADSSAGRTMERRR